MVFCAFCSCEAVANVLQGEKVTAAGALEYVKTLKGYMHVLCNKKTVEQILNKTTTSAAAHDLKMPDPAGSRVSKTPSRFHSTTEAEDVPTKECRHGRKSFSMLLILCRVK